MFHGLITYDCAPEMIIDQQDLPDHFVLKTCQRVLVIGYKDIQSDLGIEYRKRFENAQAYQFILETLCGLQSKLKGENEIVAQFKDQYSQYLHRENRNSIVCSTLEKSFQDAKKIRTQHLNNIGMQSYAGLTRQKFHEFSGREVIIIGSGRLAKDLVKVLQKHHPLKICARNQAKADAFSLPTMNWSERNQLLQSPLIVNTIGADEVLFDESFFVNWTQVNETGRLFIDLGSPSVLSTSYMRKDHVFRLDDLFAFGESLDLLKEVKIVKALEACVYETEKRFNQFSMNLPYGWDDLQLFA